MKKRLLAIFLSVCTLIGAVPSLILAAQDIIIRFDPEEPSLDGDDILALIEKEAPGVPGTALAPYGKTGNVKLLEKAELYQWIPGSTESGIYRRKADGTTEAERSVSLPDGVMFTQSVGFDPMGCGRRNYLAVLACIKDSSPYYYQKEWIYIYNLDTNELVLSRQINDGDRGWAVDNLDTADANNFFSITAGDYNGDGKDSLIVYVSDPLPSTLDDGTEILSGLYEFNYDESQNKFVRERAFYAAVELLNKEYVKFQRNMKPQYYDPSGADNRLAASLASGDVDGDGIDDLIVVSSVSNLTGDFTGANKASIPMLAVAKGAKSDSPRIDSLKVTSCYLGEKSGSSTAIMAAPDVAIGDFDGDGINEIVVAGFDATNTSDKSAKINSDAGIRYGIYRYDGSIKTIGLNVLSDISAISKGNSIRTDENTWQQCTVESVLFDGLHTKPYIFINGYIYQASYDVSAKKYVLSRASGSDALDQKNNQNDDHFAFNFLVTSCNGTNVNEVFIRSAAAGNMRGSGKGSECLDLIVGFKISGKKEYFFKQISIYKDSSGNWKMDGASSKYLNNDGSVGDTSAGCFLTCVDVGYDSIFVRYNSTYSAYTDPNVVAFLQAAPYFREFGAGNSSTIYSYSESYTNTTSNGTEFSAGVGITAGFETPVVKTEMETTFSSSVTKEYSESLTTEFTMTFEANSKNQVIIRRTLLYIYCYDVMTGVDSNGNPVYESAGLIVSVPQYPVMNSLSMEQYDEFAEAYNAKYGSGTNGLSPYYLDIISKNNGALMSKYYLNNEGRPGAYAADVSNYSTGFHMSKGDVWMGLSHAGGTSQLAYSTSVGTEMSKTVTDGLSVNVAVSVGASFAGFGSSVGVTASLSSLRSSGVSNAYVTTTSTSGSVQNLSGSDTNYVFDWQLIGWKTEADDGLFYGIPFVGYAVRSVGAPPLAVDDLSVEYRADSPGTATLKWTRPADEPGRTPVRMFYVYRTDGGRRDLLGSTSGNSDGSCSMTVSANDIYATYVVVSYSFDLSQRSGDSNEVVAIFATTKDQVKKLIEDAYTDLTGSINDLKSAIESGQAEAIKKAVEDLTKAYKEADELVKSELSEADAALEAKMNDADKALKDAIDAVQANLDKAIDNLTKLINDGDKANADALQKAISDLTNAYESADALLKSELKADLSALEERMNAADEALGNSIDAVQANLDKAIEDLTKLINDGDKANADALAKAISDLTAAYKAADDLLKSDTDGKLAALEEKMTKADDVLKEAIDTVQKNLDKAIEDLNKAIAAGDKTGSDRLAEAIDALNKAYKAADDLLKSDIKSLSDRLDELEKAMNKADEALGKSISDVRESLEQELEKLRTELKATADRMEALNREYTEKLNTITSVNSTQQNDLTTLRNLAVIGLCIAAVSMLGNVVLFTMHIKSKKAAA